MWLGQALAITEPMGQPGDRQKAAVESAVRTQPTGSEGVSVKGKLGPFLDLSLRRRHDAVSERLDGSAAMAKVETV